VDEIARAIASRSGRGIGTAYAADVAAALARVMEDTTQKTATGLELRSADSEKESALNVRAEPPGTARDGAAPLPCGPEGLSVPAWIDRPE
jgi:hypothetical protein